MTTQGHAVLHTKLPTLQTNQALRQLGKLFIELFHRNRQTSLLIMRKNSQ